MPIFGPCEKLQEMGEGIDRSQSVFYFVPQENSHSQAGSTSGAKKYFTLSLAEMILSSKEQQIHPENNTAFEKSALHWWCCHQNVHDCHGEDHDG